MNAYLPYVIAAAALTLGVVDGENAQFGIEDLLVPRLAQVPHGGSVVIDASR